jgi:hypothetical protein
MNAPLSTDQRDRMNAREHRIQRAAIARRLLAWAPGQVNALDWDTLDAAPAWLGLPEIDRYRLQRVVGAVLHAAEVRLWIDGARIAAARSALGEPVWQGLLNGPGGPGIPGASAVGRRLDTTLKVGESLALEGASVLQASLPQGPLQSVAGEMFAPVAPAEIIEPLARSIVAKAQALLSAPEVAR